MFLFKEATSLITFAAVNGTAYSCEWISDKMSGFELHNTKVPIEITVALGLLVLTGVGVYSAKYLINKKTLVSQDINDSYNEHDDQDNEDEMLCGSENESEYESEND